MSLHLRRYLENLNRQVLVHAGRVERIVDEAVKALCDRRYDLVQQILSEDDVVDRDEVRLEEDCLKALALHQP
ncbi:MAG: PhoU domain-containing protein, partial [Pirellulaceae bacterium]